MRSRHDGWDDNGTPLDIEISKEGSDFFRKKAWRIVMKDRYAHEKVPIELVIVDRHTVINTGWLGED